MVEDIVKKVSSIAGACLKAIESQDISVNEAITAGALIYGSIVLSSQDGCDPQLINYTELKAAANKFLDAVIDGLTKQKEDNNEINER